MVTTPTVPTTAIAATGTSALSKLSGNFNDFLKLLMTQLQNQDPTAPMDTNQFTTQLVQFSSVEQQIDTNASLNKLISLQQGGEVLQSAALVGKTVQVTADHVAQQAGGSDVQFTTSAAQPVVIELSTDAGNVVRQMTISSTAGENQWHWDGTDNNGRTVPAGPYRLTVKSGDSGSEIPFTTTGLATAVQRSADGFDVIMGQVRVPLASVQSVR